jgi:hypothetical protein
VLGAQAPVELPRHPLVGAQRRAPHEGGLPAGQTHHVAGPTEGGFLVSAVWDSKASADAFVSGTPIPAMPVGGGLAGPPEERVAEVTHAQSA